MLSVCNFHNFKLKNWLHACMQFWMFCLNVSLRNEHTFGKCLTFWLEMGIVTIFHWPHRDGKFVAESLLHFIHREKDKLKTFGSSLRKASVYSKQIINKKYWTDASDFFWENKGKSFSTWANTSHSVWYWFINLQISKTEKPPEKNISTKF